MNRFGTLKEYQRVNHKINVMTGVRAALGVMTLSLMLLMLIEGDKIGKYMTEGINIAVKKVIPVVFPFMVLSELIAYFGVFKYLGTVFSPILSLLGISKEGAGAAAIGLICGLPIGAKASARLYREGRITQKECEYLLTISNCPSLSFVTNAVGIGLYSSPKIGLIMWCIVMISTLISGTVLKWFLYPGKEIEYTCPICNISSQRKTGVGEAISASVVSSALATFNVCAYVIFFRTVVGFFGQALSPLFNTSTIRTLLFGLFEMSSGVSEAQNIVNPVGRALSVAFLLGWSGFSVHCQIASVCQGNSTGVEERIHLLPYILSKLMTALISSALFLLLLPVFSRLFNYV